MYPLIPKTIIDNAESIADYVFNKTIELAIIVAERRRKLACWRKIKFAAVIRLTNEDRLRRGKRMRRMPLWQRRLRIASAECEANCKADPKFMAAHKAADQQLVELAFLDIISRTRMTPEQHEEQARSFAFGNLKVSAQPELTREQFDKIIDEMPREGIFFRGGKTT